MTTTEEDIQALEHSGEWDHGVEPDVLDASFSNKNDDDEEETDKLKGHENDSNDILASPKRLVNQVRISVTKFFNGLSEKASEVTHDEHLKEEVENHTEEEVAGMKLCVSNVVHQDSFSAPC